MSNFVIPIVMWLATVTTVVDGDTVEVCRKSDHKLYKVRLARIDAPESSQTFGYESADYLRRLIEQQEVDIKKVSVDRYGRIVAEVFHEDRNVNSLQVLNGMAWAYRSYTSKRDVVILLEEHARKEKSGLWSQPNPVPPWIYRKACKE